MAGLVTFELEVAGKRYDDATRGLEALAADLGKAPDRFAGVVKPEMRKFLEGVTEALVQRHGNPYPAGTGSKSLSVRSGDLIRSLREGVDVKGESLTDVLGQINGIFYARIHETGGVITPKKAKYLTIPLPAALNTNGTPIKQSAREWDKTFVIQSKKGNLLIVRKEGRNLVPLYVLKTSVRIPPRLNLHATFNTGFPAWVDDVADRLVKVLVSGG